jgi:hypothetical protein
MDIGKCSCKTFDHLDLYLGYRILFSPYRMVYNANKQQYTRICPMGYLCADHCQLQHGNLDY